MASVEVETGSRVGGMRVGWLRPSVLKMENHTTTMGRDTSIFNGLTVKQNCLCSRRCWKKIGLRCVGHGMRIHRSGRPIASGQAPSQVVLGGRKVAIRRPRARHDGEEIPLPTVQAFTEANPRTAASSTRCSLGSRPASMPGSWTRWAPTSPREARAAKADD